MAKFTSIIPTNEQKIGIWRVKVAKVISKGDGIMLTKELINQAKDISLDWGRNYKNKFIYDLYLTIDNSGYRVATYSLKTKRITLTCPNIYMPPTQGLVQWIGYIEKKEMESE